MAVQERGGGGGGGLCPICPGKSVGIRIKTFPGVFPDGTGDNLNKKIFKIRSGPLTRANGRVTALIAAGHPRPSS